MKLIIPAADSVVSLGSTSGVPLSSYPAWSNSTNYNIGDRVHRVSGGLPYDYESVTGGSGRDPNTNQSPPDLHWVRIGLSNRYKVVDRIISDKAKSSGGDMTFNFVLSETITNVALFGLVGVTVTVSIRAPASAGGGVIKSETRNIADSPGIGDWFGYFFDPYDYTPDIVFTDLPGYAGNVLRVRIQSDSIVEIGEVVFGRQVDLGVTMEDAEVGIRDYSRKERDDFGRPLIIERPFSVYGDFTLSYPSSRQKSILQIMSSIRATPVVFWAEGAQPGVEALIFGFYNDFSLTLKVGLDSYSTLTVEGLV